MESNHHEDSKSSSEETDRSNDDSMGTGRSYECVFCKRGFTTAQALGGHMNIHRKDRAKSRQGSVASISSKVVINDDQEEYGSLIRGYPQIIQSYPPPHHQYYPTNNHHAVHINNYQSFFPSSSPPITTTNTTWGPGSFGPTVHGEDFYVQSSHQLVMDDWRSCLSLQIGASRGDRGSKEMREDGNGLQEDELDLELRLGHDP